MASHAHTDHGHGVVVHKHPSDFEGAKIAMWLFLFTEILLFGGLFLLYAVYRSMYPDDFHTAAAGLNPVLGGFNTLVLLTSSLTVAMSITALQKGNRKLSIWLLAVTIACAFIFLVVKYFEWGHKIHLGIYPGSELMDTFSLGEVVFYNLYYAMTGLHGVHVIIGMAVLGTVLYFIARKPKNTEVIDYNILEGLRGKSHLSVVSENGNEIGKVSDLEGKVERVEVNVYYEPTPETMDPRNEIKLENSGLYWHIVDVIWIFLFPLFYLIT
ncbi:MAG: cytochrome c oxidase subunit 3 family protein [Calditrichia bacterium]